ncbi:hypothetical protein [Litorilituus lipolyticus]|uniref:Uncharacterized protein n=1 Tax=Litorilituus lipolyticus TaxID=2491017 RepID=A0A502KUN6_9GAMM|nr:hypothetical protein [Litorilituus lipolyticus]TPH13935.1 hypothetical protein EPA86_12525 [Litorilituus lipolyticus]
MLEQQQYRLTALWFEFFKLNETYKKYCDAKQQNDQKTIENINDMYPHLSGLYHHWGNIHHEFNDFAVWQRHHMHLVVAGSVDQYNDVKEIPRTKSRYYLSIPLALDEKTALNQAKELIESVYRQKKNIKVKYPLRIKQSTLEAVEKQIEKLYGCLVTALEENKQSNNLSIINELGTDGYKKWPTDANSAKSFPNETREIRNFKTWSKSIIENTLHGKFPVYS